MTEPFEYIEDYFAGKLGEAERRAFEARCIDDETFAQNVAFFVSTRQALKTDLLRKKQRQWVNGDSSAAKIPVRRMWTMRRTVYTIAASAIIAVALYILEKPSSPSQMAAKYIAANYTHLSQTMGNTRDSLQHAIALYNNEDYGNASALFDALVKSNPENTDALKLSGIAYLRMGRYDQALQKFQALAAVKGLVSNPGLFLEAAALLRRDKKGDKQQAKALLETVVQQQLDGKNEAQDWLKRF